MAEVADRRGWGGGGREEGSSHLPPSPCVVFGNWLPNGALLCINHFYSVQ